MARRSARPLRLVVDTNIFISFLIGKQLKALQAGIAEGRFQFVIGEELLKEITEVASRPYGHDRPTPSGYGPNFLLGLRLV